MSVKTRQPAADKPAAPRSKTFEKWVSPANRFNTKRLMAKKPSNDPVGNRYIEPTD